ncbi:hypothetical protein G6F70_007617 [Rhizopus microsporus]|uniref:Uncharacterized protein n=2 Tax=Rhizopus TaxID=4842 RepID=A0A367JRA0_RHIAZ|nr:hypothetical protein G6F71_007602 [Rhizopus microsporus]KAG1196229.1 hypothetical protein G6F70_007617 [Rhizopus microsporus]KAG1208008.1 hypothetical protein G6F69_007588 [Rhizopus microsporus]RCH92482.1 hypothetical protein CU097_011980 [Rhizopus azygosporus]
MEVEPYNPSKNIPEQQPKAKGPSGSINSQSATSTLSVHHELPEKTSTSEKKKLDYKSWLLWWNSEEWWPCWIGLIFFGCITSAVKHNIPSPKFLPWEKNPFLTFATPGNYGLLVICVMMGVLLWLSMAATRARNWKKFPLGYSVVFIIALISKMLASNVTLHKASIGDSIWAIILGCLLRNVIPFFTKSNSLPPWLKIAQQTEPYIAISLVLLCIDISVLKPLAPRALFVSWIDTPTLFMIVAYFGWKILKIDTQTAIIMSGATFICGSSAAIALGASMGVPHKTEMPIAIISIFTIPSIIALPYIAKRFDFSATVSGAWFGGCVDSTGAVIAAASIYGDKEAIDTSAVVKMMQNILIGPLSVLMAWAWSRYELKAAYKLEEELLRRSENLDDVTVQDNERDNAIEDTNTPTVKRPRNTHALNKPKEKAYVLLWKRFPKFVLGFIITAVLFNTTIDNNPETRSLVNSFCFYVSEWFSTLSFVSIGLGLQINEMKQNIRSLGKLITLYIIAQMVDIVVTCVLAWAAFVHM